MDPTIAFTDFQAKYTFEGHISEGSFGKVCKIRDKTNKKAFALKKLLIKKEQHLLDARTEIAILTRFKHPSLVQIRQHYKIQIGKGCRKANYEIGIVLQLAKGSLQQLIRTGKTIGSLSYILQQIYGLLGVLVMFQKHHIAHRDIKPANILICNTEQAQQRSSNSKQTMWKLADLGLALNLNQQRPQNENVAGSYDYASPILKRKFRYKNLKVKSNPFKDDVYSLGVTLLEIVTGYRSLKEEARNKLRALVHTEESRDQKVAVFELINLMLREQEWERPCFLELLDFVNTNFVHLFEQSYEGLKMQQLKQKYSKSSEHFRQHKYLETNLHADACKYSSLTNQEYAKDPYSPTKTIYKRDIRGASVRQIKLENQKICSITSIDGNILCGCEHGQLIIINNNLQKIICQSNHTKLRNGMYFGQFSRDSHGNLWSVGGDGKILKFKKQALLKAIAQDIKLDNETQKNFFKFTQDLTKRNVLKLELKSNQHYRVIDVPYQLEDRRNLSLPTTVIALDQEHFAVGYSNGFVYIRWINQLSENHGEFFRKMHTEPVTCLRVAHEGQCILTSSLDGTMKCIWLPQVRTDKTVKSRKLEMNLMNSEFQMSNLIFCTDSGICSFEVYDSGAEQTINLITIKGKLQFINRKFQHIFDSQLQLNRVIDTIYCHEKKLSYILNEDGEIYDSNQDRVMSLSERKNYGWNNISVMGPSELIVSNYEGEVCLVRL